MYGEAEVDVKDTDSARSSPSGGEYQLPNKSRIYARHEFISSITGPYGLNQTERQNTTARGRRHRVHEGRAPVQRVPHPRRDRPAATRRRRSA